MFSGICGLYPLDARSNSPPPPLPLRHDNQKCFQMLPNISWGQDCTPLRTTDLYQSISFKAVRKDRSRLAEAPGGNSRCRNGHASVSTVPALSARWPGCRGRSRSSPRAWTHGPGASCTSSPAAGWNQQVRSSDTAFNPCAAHLGKKNVWAPGKQLEISNVGGFKFDYSFPKFFLVFPFLPGLRRGQQRGGAWVHQGNQFLSALS